VVLGWAQSKTSNQSNAIFVRVYGEKPLRAEQGTKKLNLATEGVIIFSVFTVVLMR